MTLTAWSYSRVSGIDPDDLHILADLLGHPSLAVFSLDSYYGNHLGSLTFNIILSRPWLPPLDILARIFVGCTFCFIGAFQIRFRSAQHDPFTGAPITLPKVVELLHIFFGKISLKTTRPLSLSLLTSTPPETSSI